MSDPADQTQIPPRELGDFDIISLLGKGGMGAVYRARQRSLDRAVALKVLATELAEDKVYMERFDREARAAAACKHPNIVGVIDAGVDLATGSLFIAFEYIDGTDLAKALKAAGGRFDEERALEIGYDLARALEHAHEKGFIHRDLKPSNVLISTEGTIKLADLGLARLEADEGSGITRTGEIIGTPHYMSPEQAHGDQLDIRSDLYSLGLMLYEMGTGTRAFQARSPMAMLTRRMTEDCPDPREEMPSLSAGFARVVKSLTARELPERCPSPTDAIQAIERALGRRGPARRRSTSSERAAAVLSPAASGGERRPSGSARARRTTSRRVPIAAPTLAERAARRGGAGKAVAVAAFTALLALGAVALVVYLATRERSDPDLTGSGELPTIDGPPPPPGPDDPPPRPPEAWDALAPGWPSAATALVGRPGPARLVAVHGDRPWGLWSTASRVSVSDDGRRVLLASHAGLAVLEHPSGRELLYRFPGDGAILGAALTPDGAIAIAGVAMRRGKGQLHAWEVGSGVDVASVEDAHDGRPLAVSVGGGPDRWTVASVDGRGPIRLWRLDPKARRFEPLDAIGAGAGVTDVVLSRDGTRVLAGGIGSSVRLFDVATKAEVWSADAGPRAHRRLALAPDADRVLAVSAPLSGATVETLPPPKLWDLTRPPEERSVPQELGTEVGLAVAFDASGERALVARRSGAIDLYDVTAADPLPSGKLPGHVGGATCVALAPDGSWAVSAGADGQARVWDIDSLAQIAPSLAVASDGHLGAIAALGEAPPPSGRFLSVGMASLLVRSPDAATVGHPFDPARRGRTVTAGAVRGPRAAAGLYDGRVVVVDVDGAGAAQTLRVSASARIAGRRDDGTQELIVDVELSADGGTVATLATGGQIGYWRPGESQPLILAPPEEMRVTDVALLGAGAARVLAIGSLGGSGRRWLLSPDARTRTLEASRGERLSGSPVGVAAAATGDIFAILLADGSIEVHDLRTGPQTFQARRFGLLRRRPVMAVSSRLLAASAEGVIELWDRETPGAPIDTIDLGPLGYEATSLAIDADERTLRVGTDRGKVLVFDLGER